MPFCMNVTFEDRAVSFMRVTLCISRSPSVLQERTGVIFKDPTIGLCVTI
jgi:hypothetical protein